MDKKSRDIFYGVVIVATLIIALVGTTLAYFSYRTGSEDEAVKARAGNINIVYNDGDQVTAQADELIPSSFEVVKNVYQTHIAGGGDPSSNDCVDEENRQVCSVYRFSVKSDISIETYALLNTEYNGFTYLAYALRDVNNNTWLTLNTNSNYLPLATCNNQNTNDSDDCYKENGEKKIYSTTPKAVNSIFGYNQDLSLKNKIIGPTEQIFDLVIFINENHKDQNVDQGKQYLGTITIEATNVIDKVITGETS